MTAPHIDRIRALLGKPPRPTAAPDPAVVAPPAVPTVATGGACQGCEDGCGTCITLARGTCDRCLQPYVGGVTHYEDERGEVVLSLHDGCDTRGPWSVPPRVAVSLAADGLPLVYDGRWTA